MVSFEKSFFSWALFRSNFRCDDHLMALPAALQPFADDRLGLPASISRHPFGINVSRIHGVESCRNERIQQLERCCFVCRPSEYVAAQHDWGNFQSRISQFPFDKRHGLLQRSSVACLNLWMSGPMSQVHSRREFRDARSRSAATYLAPVFPRRLLGLFLGKSHAQHRAYDSDACEENDEC